ncbi:MAG: anti-anti-sigma factor [Candidatus Azotimanducaceae bacterium]|jgi:anti-anti-sigma factor
MMSMGKILFANQSGMQVLKFVGDVRVCLGPTISTFLNSITKDRGIKGMVIDLRQATGIDSTSLGLLAKVSLRCQGQLKILPTIVSTNADITRLLFSMGFDKIFVIDDDVSRCCDEVAELPSQIVSERVLRDQVLEAHRTLMNLNEKNLIAFKDLVAALLQEQQEQERASMPQPMEWAVGRR